ncbi:hypothetical protein PUNSTDRAFT_129013 [Punctularia strigosozonata HHB-11173 SS5]|uniref:uncharacterized protein n=1 Tax=Punctularia strigosozonata (strain HHB-11173) TaxID=741275 RepID=UPI0004417495|nr:uncharacterized protein PUNSTDRAFT_129013 [Punctularia strigosozonata HHB-11173 SS5]EIN13326.1 hypothetical protein PUNSTDRAFT_129013 [Punctularia strigosozonata HHB-11173 SS5]
MEHRVPHCGTCSCLPGADVHDRDEVVAALSPQRVQLLEDLERELEELQNGATRVRQALLSLRTEHNRSLPVNTLPTEILSEIMVLAHYIPHLYSQWSPACAQVCTLWRHVALAETPSLWSCLNVYDRPKLAQALCKRFPTIPLRIDYSRSLYGQSDKPHAPAHVLEEIILKNPSRILSLIVYPSYEDSIRALKCFQNYAPALEKLDLICYSDRIHVSPGQETLMNCLRRVRAPNLRSLTLDAIPADEHVWNVRWFTSFSLRLLSISQSATMQHPQAGTASLLKDILDVLEACPLLEVLSLEGQLPQEELPSAPSTPPSRRVHLPMLRDISFGDTTIDCVATLFRYLQPACPATLRWDVDATRTTHFPHIWHLIRPHCASSEVDLHVGQLCFRIICPVTPGRQWPRTAIQFNDMKQLPDAIRVFLAQLNVTGLELEGLDDDPYPSEVLQAILSSCPNVRNLELSGSAGSVLDAMRDWDESDGHDGLLLPHLTDLRLVMWRSAASEAMPIPWYGECRAQLAARRQYALRTGRNMSPRTLTLVHCRGIEHAEIEWLKGIVPEVRVIPAE